jgi:hypothetical protein
VLNVHAPTEDKIDCIEDRFYEELEYAFDNFLKYHMKILLGDFNSKVGRKDIFKPTIGNESLHEISNDIGVKSSQEILLSKVQCFHIVTFVNLLGHLLMGRRTIKLTTF